MRTVKANRLKDNFNYASHATAQVALTAAATTFAASPTITALALASTGLIHFKLMPWLEKHLHNGLQEGHTPEAENKLTDLKEALVKQGKIIGMDSTPPLFLIEKDRLTGKDDKPETIKESFQKAMGKYANAFAYSAEDHQHRGITFTEKLMDKLNIKEQKAVLAHELGHIAANHTGRGRVLRMFSGIASLTTGFNFLYHAFSSWGGLGIFVASNFAGKGGKFIAKILNLDPKKHAIQTAAITEICRGSMLIGLSMQFENPGLLSAYLASTLVKQTNKLISANLSRRKEFQADRIAGQITNNPEALATGLEKISVFNMKKAPDRSSVMDYKSGSFLKRSFARALSVYKSHPHQDRRCKRLRTMAAALT